LEFSRWFLTVLKASNRLGELLKGFSTGLGALISFWIIQEAFEAFRLFWKQFEAPRSFWKLLDCFRII